MENRAHAIVAIAFLVVLVAGAVLVYMWLAQSPNEPLVYEIVTDQSVGGLTQESKVVFKGLPVGHITQMEFDPQNRTRVIIHLQLKAKTYVTHATYAEIAMQGLVGGSELELKLGKGSRAPLVTSAKHPARIPMHAGMMAKLESSAIQDMQDAKAVLGSARKLLDQRNREHISASLKQIDVATRRLAAIEAQLPALIKNVQASVNQSHALLANANKLALDARTPVRNATSVESAIQALAQSSRQLSEKLDRQTVPNFDALSKSMQRTSRQLDQLLRELHAKPQSLIFGPPKHPPGPGEPGFKSGSKVNGNGRGASAS